MVSSAEVESGKTNKELLYLEKLHVQRSFGRSLAITNQGAVNAVHGRTAVHPHDCDVEAAIGVTTASAVDMSRGTGLRKLN